MTQTATVTTVTQDGAADDMGDPTEQTATVEVRCWLHQEQRREETDNRAVHLEEWRLYLPPDTAITATSRVAVDGVPYELFGPPWPAHNPRLGRVTHIECTVRRVTT
jgi:hypothetical protein